MRRVVVLTVLVVALLAFAVFGQQTAKEACNMCKGITTQEGKSSYICPSSKVKGCQINIGGWCCRPTKEHKECKPCFALDDDEEDEVEM